MSRRIRDGTAEAFGLFHRSKLASVLYWWEEEEQAHLGWVATHPRLRRQGFAAELLDRAADSARSRGLNTMRAGYWIDSYADDSVGFLLANGFVPEDTVGCNRYMRMSLEGKLPPVPQVPWGYRLRHYQEGDEELWLDALNEIFGSNETLELFRIRFSGRPNFDPEELTFVDYHGQIVAMCGGVVREFLLKGRKYRHSYLDWLGTRQAHRGKGLARIVSLSCLHYLKRKGMKYVGLITQSYRQGAINLYKKLGFRTLVESISYVKKI